MIGERTDYIYLIKTIVTFDMLFKDQKEMLDDLFELYFDSVCSSYPEKIKDYILDLENG